MEQRGAHKACPGLLSTIMYSKDHNQSNLRKNGFLWLTHPESHSTEGKQGRNTQSRTVADHQGTLFTCLVLLVGTVCFLIHPRTICPGMALPSVLALTHQLSVNKMPHRLNDRLTGWSYFLNLNSLW